MTSSPSRGGDDDRRPLLPQRTALILLLALISAGVIAALLALAHRSAPEIALGAIAASGAAIRLFHRLLD